MLIQIEKLRWSCLWSSCTSRGIVVEEPVDRWLVVGKVEQP
jgi:hypothetical protein